MLSEVLNLILWSLDADKREARSGDRRRDEAEREKESKRESRA